jgi:predicted transcriptional regulator of viral defense system
MSDLERRLLRLAGKRAVIRPRDLEAIGVPRSYLSRLVAQGELERVGRGMYRPARARVTEHHSLAMAAVRVPKAVVCLLSALRFHNLTTQAPFEVWLAVDFKARAPAPGEPPIRVVRMSGKALTTGVEVHVLEGVRVSMTTPARTVADCFKFRNKIGLDVALEALRDFRRKRGNVDDLWRYAKVLRVANVLRPYLEASS